MLIGLISVRDTFACRVVQRWWSLAEQEWDTTMEERRRQTMWDTTEGENKMWGYFVKPDMGRSEATSIIQISVTAPNLDGVLMWNTQKYSHYNKPINSEYSICLPSRGIHKVLRWCGPVYLLVRQSNSVVNSKMSSPLQNRLGCSYSPQNQALCSWWPLDLSWPELKKNFQSILWKYVLYQTSIWTTWAKDRCL